MNTGRGLDPVALLRSIREAQPAVVEISSPQPQETPHSEGIDRFLARLPSLWQQGRSPATHKARVSPPRTGGPGRIPSKARICRHVFGQPIRGASATPGCGSSSPG